MKLAFWTAAHGLAGIALGAFGAHGLKNILVGPKLEWWTKASQYHLYASALLLVLTLGHMLLPHLRMRSYLCFWWGSFVFSGSLYTMALTGTKWLGAITPIGGSLMLVAWFWIALDFEPKSEIKTAE